MEKQSKIYGLVAIVLVVAILFMTNTGGIASTVQNITPQAAPVSTAPGRPTIAFDKKSYSEGAGVVMNIVCDANPNYVNIKSSTIVNFKVTISGNGFFSTDLIFKAIKLTANTYKGTAQFKIPIGSNTIKISVVAIDAGGRAGASAQKILTRAVTFTG